MLPGTPLPRLLDMGQCNDSYSALVVAMVSLRVSSISDAQQACMSSCTASCLRP
jgi:hypothetical protein